MGSALARGTSRFSRVQHSGQPRMANRSKGECQPGQAYRQRHGDQEPGQYHEEDPIEGGAGEGENGLKMPASETGSFTKR